MLRITELIAQVNQIRYSQTDTLEMHLKNQASAGVTVGGALEGHCPTINGNKSVVDRIVSQLANEDGVMATYNSPLQAFIHMPSLHDVGEQAPLDATLRNSLADPRMGDHN